MSKEQPEFNFSTPGNTSGYHSWRAELTSLQQAFNTKWGIPLNTKVRAKLTYLAQPIEGVIHLEKSKPSAPPTFRIRSVTFTLGEIESIQRLDPPNPPPQT